MCSFRLLNFKNAQNEKITTASDTACYGVRFYHTM